LSRQRRRGFGEVKTRLAGGGARQIAFGNFGYA
jgi:hypothetical protein